MLQSDGFVSRSPPREIVDDTLAPEPRDRQLPASLFPQSGYKRQNLPDAPSARPEG
jgi:hypothetical protein